MPRDCTLKHPGLREWIEEVSMRMPQLSKAQATGLAMWSFAIVLTQNCGLTTVSNFLAKLLSKKPATMRQRLREWYQDKAAKKGRGRRELDTQASFAYLIRWVLSKLESPEKELVISLDASTLGTRFVVLAAAVMYRGSALYIGWVVLPACEKGSWQEPWLRLLAHLKGHIPSEWTVIVLSDRGLYAKWLYQAIQDNGWHPFMRIRRGGKCRTQGSNDFIALSRLAPKVGSFWSGEVTLFKHRPFNCTLLVAWQAGYEGPWFIITDLAPEQADSSWYGSRAWIETGFKQHKRSGWHWHRTRMDNSERASRMWLALSLASFWVLAVGTQAEDLAPTPDLSHLPSTHIARRTRKNTLTIRTSSCFQQGLATILTALISGLALPLGYFKTDSPLGFGKLCTARAV